MQTTVGFIGLGAMGSPMALQLHRAGLVVGVYDIRPESVMELATAHGLRGFADPLALASESDILVMMLPTSGHVDDALFGNGGLACQLRPGSLMIDMTSGVPTATRAMGKRLESAGVKLVDAPVSGNVSRAKSGDLTIMLGGDPDDCDRAEPALRPMARTIYRTGPLGSGQAMKALNNIASAAGFWIASEVLTAGVKAGLDPALMIDILNASTGSNNSTQNKFKPFVLSGTFQGNFLLSLMVKDLGIAVDLAQDCQADTPMMNQVLALWSSALDDLGARADHTEVARLVASRSKTSLSR